jgi:heme exporter protein A
MLTIENLSLFRNYQKIFANLGLSIGLGAALIVTGKNGSGKSSLLKIIAGINKSGTAINSEGKYQLNQGKILWNNIDIEEFRADFNSDLQYIGHKMPLKLNATVIENLQFYTSLNQTEILIFSALKYFNLEQFANFEIRKLSAGWQKKVLLSLLLCLPKTLWLLDEPSNSLDQASKEKLYGLIDSRVKDGGLVIMATHDEMFFPLGVKLNMEDYN